MYLYHLTITNWSTDMMTLDHDPISHFGLNVTPPFDPQGDPASSLPILVGPKVL
jgi:hypothetical protein